MPDDNRLDLNADLDRVAGDLLKDVEAATKEVKTRKAADREKDRRNAVKDKDRKTSVIIIAVAAIVLILIASWMTFGRQPAGTPVSSNAVTQQNSKINIPASNVSNVPKAPPTAAPARRGNNQQGNEQPYDDQPPGQ